MKRSDVWPLLLWLLLLSALLLAVAGFGETQELPQSEQNSSASIESRLKNLLDNFAKLKRQLEVQRRLTDSLRSELEAAQRDLIQALESLESSQADLMRLTGLLERSEQTLQQLQNTFEEYRQRTNRELWAWRVGTFAGAVLAILAFVL